MQSVVKTLLPNHWIKEDAGAAAIKENVMRFIPTVYSPTGGSLPRADERAKADFIRQHVRHGWIEGDAIARYELWVAGVIDTNPELDVNQHQELADQAITKIRNLSRRQD